MLHTKLVFLFFLITTVFSKIYFQDTFETDPFANKRWIHSNWKKDSGEAAEFEWSGGLWPVGNRKGLRTPEDARFYAITSKFDQEFDNTGKTLVLGLSVKHEQRIDCGGGYVKLLPPTVDPKNFNGDSPYGIMFGPDICGSSTKRVQAIFRQGENLLKKSDLSCPDDEFTHTYVLVVNPDDTYDIRIDGKSEASGNLKDDWDFEKPKKIKDPKAKKPSDWVDSEHMDDPEDKKPADWDNEPEKIVDPDATKPEDWDDEEDGAWEAPLIDNPKYKGKWKAKRIKNPAYQGPWVHPEIDNPDYVEYTEVYKRGPLAYFGIEIWQVKAGSVFSDFIVADNVEEVETFFKNRSVPKDKEEAAKSAYDEANKPADDHGHDGHDHDDVDADAFKEDL
jgi:calreticulin